MIIFQNEDIGGYSIDSLAKMLVKNNKITNIIFDSESGLFCAYSITKKNNSKSVSCFKK